jgi:hypothetical protein
MPRTTAAAPSTTSTFLVNPAFELLSVNDNFTITVNLTNAQQLIGWQVEIKYNKTVLRLNQIWIPDENVFSGYAAQQTPVVFPDRDELDGFNGVIFAAALLGEFEVNVDNGVLCKANFTVISNGPALIEVTTKSNPDNGNGWYSTWVTSADVESFPPTQEDAIPSNCTVFTVSPLVGDVNGDYKINVEDVSMAAVAFGSKPGNPRWNSKADINNDGKVTIEDVALIAKNFGRHSP